jgi:hypothetical protein
MHVLEARPSQLLHGSKSRTEKKHAQALAFVFVFLSFIENPEHARMSVPYLKRSVR